MSFELTQSQLEIQQMVREFVKKEVEPTVVEREKSGRFDETEKILRKLGRMGLWGLPFPKEDGGMGGDTVSFALACMEINKVDASLGIAYAVTVSIGSWAIYQYGTKEQKEKYFKGAATGERLGAFGLTESNAGSDSSACETTAVREGDKFIINGKKIFCTNAGFADNYVVIAMTDKSKGVKGLSAFIVEKDTPGFTFGKEEDKLGIRASVQRELLFENCEVPAVNMLGKEGEGFKIAMKTLDVGRIGIGAQGVGIAQGAFEYARNYAKERIQFGKPLVEQQFISFKLAELYTDIEKAKMLVLSAANDKDAGRPYTLSAAMGKLTATDTAMNTSMWGVQLLGGHGFLKDHPVERYFRDAKITQIYEGTNEIQKIVIAGQILR